MKIFVCDTWDSLCDMGEHAIDRYCYRTREDAENAKLRKYVAWLEKWALDHASVGLSVDVQFELEMARRELEVEVGLRWEGEA